MVVMGWALYMHFVSSQNYRIIMKREKTQISKLPFDCWCCVIEYFGDPNVFKRMVLSVKGLIEYIQKVYPHCTANITFQMKEIPYTRKGHVTNLQCRMEELMEVDKIRGCRDFKHFIDRISSRFLNLERLNINGENVTKVQRPLFSKMLIETKFSHLRYLELSFMNASDLKIDSKFPRLIECTLPLLCNTESFPGFLPETDANLRIEFSKLPKLRILKLYGWSLGSELAEHHLELLTLGCTRILPFTPEQTFDVQELNIEDESLVFVSSIENFKKNLRKLVLTDDGFLSKKVFGTSESYPSDNVESNLFVIKDFPVLEEVKILANKTNNRWKILLSPSDSFLLENLPNLKFVEVFSSTKDVVLSNTPNVEILKCEAMYSNVDFKNPSETSNLRIIESSAGDEDNRGCLGPNICSNLGSKTHLGNLEVLKTDFLSIERISFSGYPKLKNVNLMSDSLARLTVTEISNCPCLESVTGLQTQEDFVMNHDSLPSLKTVSLKSSSPFHFFESLNGTKLDSCEISYSTPTSPIDLFLLPDNICGILKLELEDIQKVVIHGDRNIPTRLERLELVSVDMVELHDLQNVKECEFSYAKEVEAKNCPNLEMVNIKNLRCDVDRIEVLNLPSLKRMEITVRGIIRKMDVCGIPTEIRCRSEVVEMKCVEEGDGDNHRIKFLTHIVFDL